MAVSVSDLFNGFPGFELQLVMLTPPNQVAFSDIRDNTNLHIATYPIPTPIKMSDMEHSLIQ